METAPAWLHTPQTADQTQLVAPRSMRLSFVLARPRLRPGSCLPLPAFSSARRAVSMLLYSDSFLCLLVILRILLEPHVCPAVSSSAAATVEAKTPGNKPCDQGAC
eukprot:2105010-Rhodomonas_salina.1